MIKKDEYRRINTERFPIQVFRNRSDNKRARHLRRALVYILFTILIYGLLLNVESLHSGIVSCITELLLDAEKLVVLSYTLRP